MDIEEFEKRQQPRAKRSRLEPFQAQIFELKAKGYANWQVCQWLEANGLKVSQEAVRKFIKSREGSPAPASMPSTTTGPAAAPVSAPPVVAPTEPEAQEVPIPPGQSTLKKKGESKAKTYLGGNPFDTPIDELLNQTKETGK